MGPFSALYPRVGVDSDVLVSAIPGGAEILLCHELPLDTESLAARVAAALAGAGFADARVEARTVDSIPRLQSGKVKRFVPLR